MEIRIIVDDRMSDKGAALGMKAEHGLCIYIAYDGKKILFDCGASDMFIRNAEKAGVDVSDIDALVISHGHYDHTGGVPAFCRLNSKAGVYIHKDSFRRTYHMRGGVPGSETTGIRWSGKEKKEVEGRLIFTDGPVEIFPDAVVTGRIEEDNDALRTETFYYKDGNGEYKADDMSHEQCLVIKHGAGIYVFSGCCHKGASSSLSAAKKLFPDEKTVLFAAGMHLSNASDDDIKKTCDILERSDAENVIPLHCTGKKAADAIKARLGARCIEAATGDDIYGC